MNEQKQLAKRTLDKVKNQKQQTKVSQQTNEDSLLNSDLQISQLSAVKPQKLDFLYQRSSDMKTATSMKRNNFDFQNGDPFLKSAFDNILIHSQASAVSSSPNHSPQIIQSSSRSGDLMHITGRSSEPLSTKKMTHIMNNHNIHDFSTKEQTLGHNTQVFQNAINNTTIEPNNIIQNNKNNNNNEKYLIQNEIDSYSGLSATIQSSETRPQEPLKYIGSRKRVINFKKGSPSRSQKKCQQTQATNQAIQQRIDLQNHLFNSKEDGLTTLMEDTYELPLSKRLRQRKPQNAIAMLNDENVNLSNVMNNNNINNQASVGIANGHNCTATTVKMSSSSPGLKRQSKRIKKQ